MTQKAPPAGGWQNLQIQPLLGKIQELENFCASLKKENEDLKKEIKNLKLNSEKTSEPRIEYFTDEDEVIKETEFILSKPKRQSKKRRIEGSPDTVLETEKETTPGVRLPSPPPIMLSGVDKSYQEIHQVLKNNTTLNFSLKLTGKDSYKINLYDSSDYRKITKIFNENKLSWNSYENKQTRKLRVIVKDLHHSCDPDEIVSDLKQQGLKVTNAFRKLKWKTKEPLNMFVVCFEPSEEIKKVYEIKHILNSVVKVEPLKPSKLIPQCKSCQGFLHTKNYCCKPPKCVKCAGNHATIECTKEDTQPPKCCNCGKNHPASYRGCEVAKHLQKLRNKSTENRNEHNTRKTVLNVNATVVPDRSFAEVVSEKNNNSVPSTSNALEQILSKLNEQTAFNQLLLKRIEKLEQKQDTKKSKA